MRSSAGRFSRTYSSYEHTQQYPGAESRRGALAPVTQGPGSPVEPLPSVITQAETAGLAHAVRLEVESLAAVDIHASTSRLIAEYAAQDQETADQQLRLREAIVRGLEQRLEWLARGIDYPAGQHTQLTVRRDSY
jgi:hypothetical protein